MINYPESLTYFDIECARAYPSFEEAPDAVQKVWWTVGGRKHPDHSPDESYKEFAALYPEFGRVVSISVGGFRENDTIFRIKNFRDPYEKTLLAEAHEVFSKVSALCGHYIIEFDIPYLAKRFLANGMSVPGCLNTVGMKPWEVPHIDTYNLWKFGSYRNSASLDAICMMFGVESPKGEMDGSDVGDYFWDGKLDEIGKYNDEDVRAVMEVALKMSRVKLDYKIENA